MRKVTFQTYTKECGWVVHEDGMFHQWGICYEEFPEGGPMQYSYGIVEDSTGKIHEVPPCKITFINITTP
jgi:hypothetical protein